MKINEIVTEAPVGFFKGLGNAIKSKLAPTSAGRVKAAGASEAGVASNAIFKAIAKWAGGQSIDLDNMTIEDLQQCSVFPSDKEQAVLNKAIDLAIGRGASTAASTIYINKKQIEDIATAFVAEYRKAPKQAAPKGFPTQVFTNWMPKGGKGTRYSFTPPDKWFKVTRGGPQPIAVGSPIIDKLNQARAADESEI